MSVKPSETTESLTNDGGHNEQTTKTSIGENEIVTLKSSQVSTVAAATASSSSSTTVPLQKIAPKPSSIVKPSMTSGKIVFIKSPNGTPQPLRIGGQLVSQSTATVNNSNLVATSPSIQIIKTLDGNILQIKNKNAGSGTTATVAQSTTASVVTTSANNTRVLLKNSSGTHVLLSNAKTIPTTTTPTTVTKLSIPSAKLKELVSSSSAMSKLSTDETSITSQSSASLTSSTTTTQSKNAPTILNKTLKPLQSSGKILIQSSTSSSNAQTVGETIKSTSTTIASTSSPNVVKLPTNSQLRAVNVGGKGVQYVRVLNSVTLSNGSRQQPVFVQRKIVPQTQATDTSVGGNKSTQFITKKLEVTPISSTANTIHRVQVKPSGSVQTVSVGGQQSQNNNQTQTKSNAVLLNNQQRTNLLNSSIGDSKSASNSNQTQTFEISIKNSNSKTNQKEIGRSDKLSNSPESNQWVFHSTQLIAPSDSSDGK